MRVSSQIKTVLWSFIGLAPPKDRGENREPPHPLVLLLVAFVLVAVFLGTLAFIAHMAVKG
jgi:hypothetical protein